MSIKCENCLENIEFGYEWEHNCNKEEIIDNDFYELIEYLINRNNNLRG